MIPVALWRVSLNGTADAALLCESERERAARFRFAHDRAAWTAARAGLRRVLAVTLGGEPAAVQFSIAPGGKPRLASDKGHARVRFSLSHTRGLALVAVTQGVEVGVDAEAVRPDIDPLLLAPSVLTPDELAHLNTVPEAARPALFFALWTAKEAVLKAEGRGLFVAPASFSVLPICAGQKANVRGFCVQPLPVDAGYAAALALPEEAGPTVVTWHELCKL